MTDAPHAHELASALHDGEAADGERARAGDPDVVAAGQAVASIADRIADVPPPADGLLDAHVSAALTAFDRPAGDRPAELDAPAPADSGVLPITSRRRWTQRRSLGAVAAAVAVVALAGALGLADTGDDQSADDTATAALDADESNDGAVAEAFDAEAGTAAGGTSPAGDEREVYGSYDQLAAALAERVVGADRADAADTTGGATSDDAVSSPAPATEEAERSGEAGCDPVAGAGLDPARVHLVSAVLVADRLVTAIVHETDDGLALTVVDDGDCDVVDERPLVR